MSAGFPSDDPPAGSAQRWIESLHQARNTARGIFDTCADARVNPEQSIDPPSPVRRLHTALWDYARHVGPRSENLRGGIWTAEIGSVPVPVEGTYNAGRTDRDGNIPEVKLHNAVEKQQVSVTLDSLLDTWAGGITTSYTLEARDRQEGRLTQSYTHTCYIPVAVAKDCMTMLDECVDDLGWVPPETPEDTNATNREDVL